MTFSKLNPDMLRELRSHPMFLKQQKNHVKTERKEVKDVKSLHKPT